MKILAIDSSTKTFSIALSEDANLIAEHNLELDRRLSEELIDVVKDLLKKARISLSRIDGLCVGLGPGSFTGLRIGISFMKGLSLALRKPLVGVSGLDALAYGTRAEARLICPIIDAKRNNLYSCIYEFRKTRLIRKSEYLLLDIKSLIKKINKPVVFLGDGINLYKERILEEIRDALFLPLNFWYPRASIIARLSSDKLKKKKRAGGADIRPLYLYPKECQIKSIDSSRLQRS